MAITSMGVSGVEIDDVYEQAICGMKLRDQDGMRRMSEYPKVTNKYLSYKVRGGGNSLKRRRSKTIL